jgi:DTW domain-containing protein
MRREIASRAATVRSSSPRRFEASWCWTELGPKRRSKAKTLWWRNPWLNKLNRMSLAPAHPSIYGKLRAEPRREFVSTLESVAAALTLCGEAPEIATGLERVFRTLVQRVRDAQLIPAPRPRRA